MAYLQVGVYDLRREQMLIYSDVECITERYPFHIDGYNKQYIV